MLNDLLFRIINSAHFSSSDMNDCTGVLKRATCIIERKKIKVYALLHP